MSTLRFVAFLAKAGTLPNLILELVRAYEGRSGWRCVLTSAELKVYVAANDDVRVFPDGGGVVLGALFGISLRERECARIRETGGRWLLESAWGSYVALWLGDGLPAGAAEGRSDCHVFRDPSGQMPCYRWSTSACEIFFSDFEDVADLALPSPSINWPSVRAFLENPESRTRETGLVGLSELLAGERLTLTSTGEEITMLWDAGAICRRGWIDDAERAQAELRSTTQTVIETWGRRASLILHHLSGGFDSAVVLGCAAGAGFASAITAINRFTLQAGEDERSFARAAAERAGVALMECAWRSDAQALECLRAAPRMVGPSIEMLGLIEVATCDALAHESRATVQWTGQGGDHLFFQMPTDLGAADAWHRHGFGRAWMGAMRDAARFTRRSYWSVLASLLRARRRDRLDLPPGKDYQATVIARLVNRPDPLRTRRQVPELHPLISQPLMELALRIPTDLLLRGGRPRALARAAFRDRVPEVIAARDGKGGTTVHLATLLRRNRDLLRDLRLDGRLVREGLIDRARLKPYLVEGHPLRAGDLSFVLACLTAELWLQQVA